MDNTREKLRELIKESIRESGEVCCNNVCDSCQYNKYGNDCGYAARADILIANGVTFATDNNVGDKWISVKDRLPSESYGTVLVCHADKFPYNDTEPFVNAMHDRRIVIGSYSEHTGTWYCNMGGTLHDITHWMPLPEPPKGE